MWSRWRLDVRYALRSMWRQPIFTSVLVATLAIGIGANTAMFGLIHAALLKPLPYEDPDRLVLARRTVGGVTGNLMSAPDYYDYREQATGLQRLAASSMGAFKATLTGGQRPERVGTMVVSHDLVSTLGVATVAGRSFTAGEGKAGAPYVVMVGERLAQRRFGSARAAVGRQLALTMGRGPVSAAIVGVLPVAFRFLDDAEVWTPIREGEFDGPETRRFHNWYLVGRLKAGVSIDTAQVQVDLVSQRLQRQYPATNKDEGLRLDPLQAALLGSQTPRLVMLMCAVGLVLLIACANVAGMLLARGVARRSELALRGALGASRGRIAGQLLTESVSLSAVAGVAGLVLASWLQRLLPIATGLARAGVTPGGLEARVLLFALAASLATGVVCGVVPALRASSLRLVEHLAPGSRATESRGGARLRSALVAGQVALSVVLLIGAGLLIRSLSSLMATDLGFEPKNLLTTSIVPGNADEKARLQFQTGLYEDLAAIPGVTAVTFTSHMPILQPFSDPPVWAADRPPVDSSQERTAFRRAVMPGFFKTLGIPVVAGRELSPTDRAGTPRVMVINDAMARQFFPGENPLGRRVVVAGGKMQLDYEVVGVVRGARTEVVANEPFPAVYVSANQAPLMTVNILLRSTLAPEALARQVRALVAARDPEIPVDPLVSMEQLLGSSLVNQRVTTLTLTAFSAIALFLAALGLYGILTHYVTQRTHEIGVRLALGAGAPGVVVHVLRRAALMVVPGLGVGLLVALASTRLIARLLYGVPPTDPATFVGVTSGLALVAFAASAWPAWRAARIDPVRALRGE